MQFSSRNQKFMLLRVSLFLLLISHVGLAFSLDPSQALEQSQIKNRQLFFASLTLTLPIIFYFWYRHRLALTIASFLISTLIYGYLLESILVAENQYSQRQYTKDKLSAMSSRLQLSVQENLSMITGFAAYISAKPDLNSQEFNQYAKVLYEKDILSLNFAGAKDLVVNFIYPMEGNEQALGLNYRESTTQKEMVERVIKSKNIMMVGPIDLVQGGTAFIGRAPIFNQDGSLWGIISSPILMSQLFKNVLEEAEHHDLDIAIKNYDIDGTELSIFLGQPSIFEHLGSSSAEIQVGGGKWVIAAKNKIMESKLPRSVFAMRSYFILAAILISLFIWYRFKQESIRENLERELKSDNALFNSIGEVARIGGWKVDKNLSVKSWSAQLSLAIGSWIEFEPTSLQDFKSVLSDEHYNLLIECINKAFESGVPFDIEIKINTTKNKPVWIRTISNGQRSVEGSHLVGTIQDVTDKVLSNKLIEHQANYDNLTGLPNRLFYNDRLNKAIEHAQKNQLKLAVLFVDIDKFKPINDNYGHQTGDNILVEAAARIKSCIGETDTVSRLSGDEFAVILTNIEKYRQVKIIAENILSAMQRPFLLEKKSIYLSTSIGMSLYPNDANTASELLRKADQAMYEVKENGRNGCHFYTKEMQIRSEYKHELLSELIVAIDHEQITPYFQPIIELSNNKMTKCEALARWTKHDGVSVPPIDFIHLAEESGLINKLDLLMLKSSCKALSKLNQKIGLSINISPRLFHTKDRALEEWTSTVTNLSKTHDITVEITERLLSDESNKALDILDELKSFGIKIAIDDFGTGYSSLSYLVKYPVDIIKIDRTFIKNITIDKISEALIETILAMAKRLNISVVAEGIEEEKQLTYLKDHQCHFGQGYLLGKPMDEASFLSYLENKAF